MAILTAFCFGLIFGSFLNVCIYRIPREKSLVWPGSGCPHCQAPIKWYDNVPLLSFLLLRGRCRGCGKSISWRYPLVELLTGLLTALWAAQYWGQWLWLAASLAAVYALISLSFIDVDFFIIPDRFSVGLLVLGLVSSFINPNFSGALPYKFAHSLLGAAASFGLMWLLAEAGERLFKKEAMGGGDLKLMAGVGALVGWQGAVSTLMIGSFFGAVYGIGMLLFRRAGRGDPIPFGPFLSMAALTNMYHLIPLSAFIL